MADVPLVDVADSSEQFLEDLSELVLVQGLEVAEVGEGKVLHDQIGQMFVEVEIEGIVFDDAGVSQIFDVDEVALEFEDVLGLHGYFFDCVDFIGFEVLASMDDGVGSFPYFREQLVFGEEGVEVVAFLFLVLV